MAMANIILTKIEKYILYATVFLIPLVLFPFFANPYDPAKLTVLVGLLGLILIVKFVKTIATGKFAIAASNFDLAVSLFAVTYLLSAIFRTPNKPEAFFLPGMATAVIASVIFYFLLNEHKDDTKGIIITLFVSALGVSFVSLFSFLGVWTKIPQLPEFTKQKFFNTLGSPLPTAIFLIVVLPLAAKLIVKEKDFAKKLFYSIASLIIVMGLGVSAYLSFPGKGANLRFLDYNTSWQVAVETLKQSPILGTGPGNYATAFNLFRPLTYNQTSLWPFRFTSARAFYLTMLTETGLLGLAALVVFAFSLWRFTKEKFDAYTAGALALILVGLGAFSATITLIFVLFILLSLNSKSRKININLTTEGTLSPIAAKIPAMIVGVPVILAVLALYYLGYRAAAAEAVFNKGLLSLANNKAQETYDAMRSAIRLDPYVDRYHSTFSQVNLAIAGNIAQKQDLNDTDRSTVAQLIQQAVSESKAAVAVNPQRAGNWQLLGQTYQAIMAFAQGADAFATQSFTQAVALDPINPNLRIALGGVYYALGNYDNAIDAFSLAVTAKPDLANSHFNLAIAYRDKGETDKAITEMNTVLSLVQKDSADYTFAKNELDKLEANKPAGTATQSANLTPPSPAPEQVIKPPLELPKEATPPSTNK